MERTWHDEVGFAFLETAEKNIENKKNWVIWNFDATDVDGVFYR